MVAAATHCPQAYFKWRFGCLACFIGRLRDVAGVFLFWGWADYGVYLQCQQSLGNGIIMQFDLESNLRKHVGCSLWFLPWLVKDSVYTLDVRYDFYCCWWRKAYTRWMFAIVFLVKKCVNTLDGRYNFYRRWWGEAYTLWMFANSYHQFRCREWSRCLVVHQADAGG